VGLIHLSAKTTSIRYQILTDGYWRKQDPFSKYCLLRKHQHHKTVNSGIDEQTSIAESTASPAVIANTKHLNNGIGVINDDEYLTRQQRY